jgi:hypothetical protein
VISWGLAVLYTMTMRFAPKSKAGTVVSITIVPLLSAVDVSRTARCLLPGLAEHVPKWS